MKCIVLINNKLTRKAINSYKIYTYKVNNNYEKLV